MNGGCTCSETAEVVWRGNGEPVKVVDYGKDIVGTSINLFESEDIELLVNENDQTWQDVEFEVALDSGFIVNVCRPDDCPGYVIQESLGSKRGQNFVVGDGKTPQSGRVESEPGSAQRQQQQFQCFSNIRGCERHQTAHVSGKNM